MTTRIINLKDFANELGKFNHARLEEYKKAAVIGVVSSIPALVENSPIDTGQYAASWDFSIGEANVILGNFAPHAPVIEYGARPFRPPIAPLLAWAKRVLQDPSQPPAYSSRVWALAKHTQKKIERVGMMPRRVMEKHIPMIIENIKKEFAKL